ncbi:MAG: 1-(5-phosphoribosyl)-5-[Clostridia bacterium]|nr:1-(5-phosphoribosyl)-5-[(5-phosphoribosylamino)methylideneamino]imidazole-4-carboxamide isomerase [Clostridia bacterium]
MNIFPAIDLMGGQAVRLMQGDYKQKTVYSDSPVSVAKGFADAGATCLHLVDLDGAKDGTLANFDTVKSIIAATSMFAEIGGGIRTEERILRYLDAGAGRVILGTIAVKDPDFTARMASKYGEKIAVGVDAKNSLVATDGWLNTSGVDSFAFCRHLRDMGVKTVIYTDIACDGAMRGTNLSAYARLSRIDGLDVVASGGVSSLDEIKKLAAMRLSGAILGKALYTGALDLGDALAAAREEAGA